MHIIPLHAKREDFMRTVETNLKYAAVLAMLLLSSCGGGGGGPLDIGPTPPVAGQAATISYVSATPSVVSLVNALTGSKTSVVRFIVRDALGNSVADGTAVNFTLTGPSGGKPPSNGGEYLNPLDATPTTASTTTLGGVAETILVSGAVAGPATVTASVPGTAVSTLSGAISIGGGVPSSDHFRLAASQVNLAAVAGKSVTISAYLADRWGNTNGLVGTMVSFMAEDGAIHSAAADSTGKASVTYLAGAGAGSISAVGKVTILATTQGAEAFVDTNGNGLYDIGEAIPGDQREPFLDVNSSGFRDASENYIDVNGNGMWDDLNGLWDGPNCPAAGCRSPATIWTSIVLTLSTNANCAAGISPGSGWLIADGNSTPFTFTVQDLNGNSMIGGTTVTVTKNASEGTLSGETSATIPDTASGPATLTFVLADSSPGNAGCPVPITNPTGTCPTAASVTVTVTPPASSGLTGCVTTSVGQID
jgi:hypothetical protein